MARFGVGRSSLSALVAMTVALGTACSDAVGPAGAIEAPVTGLPATPGAPSAPSVSNPLAGTALYVDAFSRARSTADAWRVTRPADAAQMEKIAAQGSARWFGGWNSDVQGDVDRTVAVASSSNAIPVLVAYNIPQRDCGSYSAGGAGSADGYRSWIAAFARGIGARRAVVILEPDALPGMDCLSAADQSARTGLLAYAVNAFKALGSTAVYIDAGHSRWHPTSVMATRLKAAGVEIAAGFSLNVSNFYLTSDEMTYGNALSSQVGGKHYVIDTSRNGLGATADGQWCNPAGRALGERPTTNTGNALVDAYLWIKTPGESDGSCNGSPGAGEWMPEYALGLALRADY